MASGEESEACKNVRGHCCCCWPVVKVEEGQKGGEGGAISEYRNL